MVYGIQYGENKSSEIQSYLLGLKQPQIDHFVWQKSCLEAFLVDSETRNFSSAILFCVCITWRIMPLIQQGELPKAALWKWNKTKIVTVYLVSKSFPYDSFTLAMLIIFFPLSYCWNWSLRWNWRGMRSLRKDTSHLSSRKSHISTLSHWAVWEAGGRGCSGCWSIREGCRADLSLTVATGFCGLWRSAYSCGAAWGQTPTKGEKVEVASPCHKERVRGLR